MPANPNSSRLLRSLARQTAACERGELTRLAGNVDDWSSCLALAREHRVATLLFRRLEEADCGVPPEIKQELSAEYSRNYLQCLTNAAELIQLLVEFRGESIAAMPMKGVVLAAAVYGDLAARSTGDLDLLIRYSDLAAATAILRKHGYELTTPCNPDGSPAVLDYYEFHFERPSDGMVVELRWRLELIQPRFRRDLGMDWVWPSRRTTTLAGADVPDMSPETTLLTLSMHGCKHLWSRLSWICDVAELLAARPNLDWNEARRQAKEHGLLRSLTLGVLLAVRVAGARVPPAVLRQFEADSSLSALARHFDENLFDAPGSVPSSRIPYSIRVLDNGDRARMLLSMNYWKPNERDIGVVPLPGPLHPFYRLLRPLRLLLDRSPRV